MQKSCLVDKTPRSVIIVDTWEKNFSVSKMSLKFFGVTIDHRPSTIDVCRPNMIFASDPQKNTFRFLRSGIAFRRFNSPGFLILRI